MAATFRPVNSPLSAADPPRDDSHASAMAAMTTTMTMRPTTALAPATQPLDDGPTPTRATFAAAPGSSLASQKPLPNSPFPESVQVPSAAPTTTTTTMSRKREHSQHSRRSKESDDVDMDDSDPEPHPAEEPAQSDDDSQNADEAKSKKKKSQRFYCTDYPPCNLSFTRSEHLARHIRKHTGERPFQCHCSRRFSRLDNLRQHAQTVHVNEDIPIDSLAASGTRFQRQIRTDRVRQAGRARSSTAGSAGPGGRGHSKSLSTSNIPSLSPLSSAYSLADVRRRPAPLIMADNRPRTSLESFRGPDGQFYRPPSPGDFSTPTSATFSTGQSSPRWGPVVSPNSTHTRSHSMYSTTGARTPGRRLSVPSAGNPFQSPLTQSTSQFGPLGINTSNAGAFSPAQSSLLGSPTSSTWSRRDSMSSAADEAWRRRTWHPDTREYTMSSRLSQVLPPPEIPPEKITLPPLNPVNPPPKQTIVLPPIQSFDQPPPPPRKPSPMLIDSDAPPRYLPRPEPTYEERQAPQNQWDGGLHQGLTRLDINNSTPPRDSAGAWANEANQALLARVEQARVRFEPEVKTMPSIPPPAPVQPPSQLPSMNPAGTMGPRHQHTVSAPAFSSPRESRRHGWYNGPVTVHRPTETIQEVRTPHVDRIVHPNISSFRGFPARQEQQQPPQPQQPPVYMTQGPPPTMERMERIPERPANQPGSPESLRRLEALVAVATGQGPVATAS
ncbi:hypothetical protein VTJ04DRAFT_10904 [Mycothermus thermophilus]|uniref:uncharacterized protein n=1 Tax=Humicola insolens TaxID=85995 RepID=UPI0037422E5D